MAAVYPTYKFEVDWTKTGVWVDETAYLQKIRYSRGSSGVSQFRNRAGPGLLTADLNNENGRFSRFNPSSPLTGNIKANRPCRFSITAPVSSVRWQGYLWDILPKGRTSELPLAQLEARGPLDALTRVQIKSAGNAGATTDVILGLILDAAGWPAGATYRDLSTGDVTTSRWYLPPEGQNALEAAREIEDTEAGFLGESRDGKITFREKSYRLASSLVSQGVYSDMPGEPFQYNVDLIESDTVKEIVNRAASQAIPYTVGGLAVLWTCSEIPLLPAGQSITFIAVYPSSGAVSGGVAVDAWTTPVVGTDITQTGVANANIIVSVVKYATTMEITILNNHASATATLTLIRARGTPIIAGDPTRVLTEDTASQADYGVCTPRISPKWFGSITDAKAWCDYVVALNKEVGPALTINFDANSDSALFTNLMARELHQRITAEAEGFNTEFGLSGDFYIEGINEAIDFTAGAVHRVSLNLTFVPNFDYWIVGTSILGSETFLGP